MRPTATRLMCRFGWLQLLYLRGNVTIDYCFFCKWGRQLSYAPPTLVLIEWDLTYGLIQCFSFTQVDIRDFATALLDTILR
jgi:hypothetical protein